MIPGQRRVRKRSRVPLSVLREQGGSLDDSWPLNLRTPGLRAHKSRYHILIEPKIYGALSKTRGVKAGMKQLNAPFANKRDGRGTLAMYGG
jgi:hypothetical protein